MKSELFHFALLRAIRMGTIHRFNQNFPIGTSLSQKQQQSFLAGTNNVQKWWQFSIKYLMPVMTRNWLFGNWSHLCTWTCTWIIIQEITGQHIRKSEPEAPQPSIVASGLTPTRPVIAHQAGGDTTGQWGDILYTSLHSCIALVRPKW